MKPITSPGPVVGERTSFPSRFLSVVRGFADEHAATLIGICLVAAVVAQYLVDQNQLVGPAGLAYVAAAVLLAGLLRGEALVARRCAGPRRRAVWVAWRPVIAALLLGAVAYARFGGNRFHADATLVWGLGLLLLAYASWAPCPSGEARAGDSSLSTLSRYGLTIGWPHLALLGIVAIGAFYRLHKLDEIPLEMGCDLPLIYENIGQILDKEFPIFFPSHPGREGLFFYWGALFGRVFGLDHFTIKLSAAIAGVVTLPVMYHLGKELFNPEVGLYAALFTGVSHWHIILTRVGYRACLAPLLIALAWLYLVRGLRSRRRWFFALSGFCLGLGLHTYNAFMVAPLMIGFMLLGEVLVGRGRDLAANLQGVVLLALVAVYVSIPLGRYACDRPDMYGYRAATRVTGLESALPADLPATLLGNLRRALLMFNYRGDAVFVANVPHMRQLGYFTAVLFALGLPYLLWRWRKGYNLTVLVSLGLMLWPTILSLAFPHEVPNAIRAIGALPAAMVIPAVSLALLRRRLCAQLPAQEASACGTGGRASLFCWPWGGSRRLVLVALLALVLATETVAVYPVYFKEYVSHLPGGNYSISLEMARVIDDFADDGLAYIKIWPHWYDGNAVRVQLRHVEQSWPNELEVLRPGRLPLAGPPGKLMVIVHPRDAEALGALREAFPKGIELQHSDNAGEVAFIAFYGERWRQ